MNNGLIEGVREIGAYILGDNKVPVIPYQQDADWRKCAVAFEKQSIPGFDTWNCTGFATTTQIEILEKRLYGIERNYSDRWLGIIAGTKVGYGNDPQVVYEAIRKYGLIPESLLPFSKDIQTPEEYFSFKGADKDACYAAGRKWLEQYDFKHEWLWNGKPPTNYLSIIKDAQKTSPIAVSVQAWTEQNGEYVSNGDSNNHWTLGVFFDDGKEVVFDTYMNDGTNYKTLAQNHVIRLAKRIWINRKTKSALIKHRNLLQKLVDMLMQRKTLVEICRARIGTDASPLDEAQDELACANTVSVLLNEAYGCVPTMVSTIALTKYLEDPANGFRELKEPQEGCIIMSTTEGTNIGHTGVVLNDDLICSNDSGLTVPTNKGKLLINYTVETWKKHFEGKGLSTRYFIKVV